jgi:hypothetical protein
VIGTCSNLSLAGGMCDSVNQFDNLVNDGTNTMGAAWLATPIRVGFGPVTIHAYVSAEHGPSAGIPGDGWALVLANDPPGALVATQANTGNFGGTIPVPLLGIPYTRHGVAMRWSFNNWYTVYPNPPADDGDYVYVDVLYGSLPASDMVQPGTQIPGALGTCNVSCNTACPLDACSAMATQTLQHVDVVYVPDDPNTPSTNEEAVQLWINNSYHTPSYYMVYSRSLNFLGSHVFTPGSNMWVGFTAGTSSRVGQVQLIFDSNPAVVHVDHTCP